MLGVTASGWHVSVIPMIDGDRILDCWRHHESGSRYSCDATLRRVSSCDYCKLGSIRDISLQFQHTLALGFINIPPDCSRVREVSQSRSRTWSTIIAWRLTRTTHRSGGSLAKVVIVTLAANPFAWVVVNHICEVVPMLTRLNDFTATAAVTRGGYSSKNTCRKLGTGSTSSGWRHCRHGELFGCTKGYDHWH